MPAAQVYLPRRYEWCPPPVYCAPRSPPVSGRRAAGGNVGAYITGVRFRGLNRAGGEFGDEWDGWSGQTYFEFPDAVQMAAELAYYGRKGFNILRLPISWERLQHELSGDFDTAYKTRVAAFVKRANTAAWRVILDLHNYNRYATGAFDAAGQQVDTYSQHVLGDGVLTIAHLVDVWTRMATLFKGKPR